MADATSNTTENTDSFVSTGHIRLYERWELETKTKNAKVKSVKSKKITFHTKEFNSIRIK